jgi:DNA mismatch repair protein MutS
VVNLHLDATEHGDDLVFLHAVREGPANRSYGLAVAKLAGVPREVIGAARGYLAELEAQRDAHPPGHAQGELFAVAPRATAAPASAPPPAPPVRPKPSAVEKQLAAIDPDGLTPREALQRLYELRRALDS